MVIILVAYATWLGLDSVSLRFEFSNNRESRPPVDFFKAEKRLNFAPKQPL